MYICKRLKRFFTIAFLNCTVFALSNDNIKIAKYKRVSEAYGYIIGQDYTLNLIKKEFPSIRKKLWKEYFWSQSFCLLTTGGAPINILKKYIESQGIKNGKKS